MSEASTQRRLSAILVMDVAGYSRLMARDETGTFEHLAEAHDTIILPLTGQHHGRLVKRMGDGFLLEFPSIVDAVNFALAFQEKMATANEPRRDGEKLIFRIGINFGDVIGDGSDIYGDGVNIAARLEPLAPPGGICISAKVEEEIRGKIDTAFEPMGARALKNIPTPVETYAVRIDPSAPPIASRRPRRLVIAGAVVAVAAGLVGGAYFFWPGVRQVAEPAREALMAHPLPDKPSIAVLPFKNVTAQDEAGWFADGVTEDLITDLSKVDGLFVISRNSSFTFKGKETSTQQAAETLGVRYVLEGSVRRAGNRVRINAQLVETITGGAVWAERYDGDAEAVFDLQDEITSRIIAELTDRLLPGGPEVAAREETENPAAHDAYLRGLALYRRGSPQDYAAAARAFSRAMELDTGYERPRTALAKTYAQAAFGVQDYADALGLHWADALARSWVLLAKETEEPNADRQVIRSWLALRKHQHERAIADAERALILSPNDTDAMEALAEAEIYAGRAQAGLKVAEQALRQNPAAPAKAHYLIGLANYAQGQPQAALEALDRAIAAAPGRRSEFAGIRAATLAELGRDDDAREAFEVFSRGYLDRPSMSWTVRPETFRNPRFHTWRNIDLAWAVFTHPFRDPLVQERFAVSLRVAGAPEGIGGYLPLNRGNRLEGAEIREAAFGREISGSDFWLAEKEWRQTRTEEGEVTHHGVPIHVGPPQADKGEGTTRDNLLCERWLLEDQWVEICSSVYRMFDARSRARWGDYVMVTDIGPFPFSVVE
ncbi:adenylate/guanylate cyclase domain-containing protein [Rhizobiales bacterium]|uniref:adenylate/guanylate cyclase domain-containing protein n=1 Tax=Hongsoonwoonella zoysiae TaxID=2821844 RepID=UPI00155FA877|nr:adenylate/guanylate cyclase domain-containing protein [Hongsoonwoonella zoysiae]NRG18606.1 adenylate/guanylate cyclase domain-containing protein [Hongsoonwoonella zoysiae]